MTMYPFHWFGSVKRQGARQHLIERDTKGVQVSAGIDGSIHPSGLLGRHICQRSGDRLGGIRRLAFASEARSDAESGQPHLTGRLIKQDIGRLYVLVNEPTLVKLTQSRR